MKDEVPGAPTDTWSAYPPLAYAWTYANRPRKAVSAELPPLRISRYGLKSYQLNKGMVHTLVHNNAAEAQRNSSDADSTDYNRCSRCYI
jgi:hypothetical protein